MNELEEFDLNDIDVFGMETVSAISTLVVANHYIQALILLYSAIDILAWVGLRSGDVEREDFCNWVDSYMSPETSLGCTSKDIYAARCSMLHSGSAKSKLSRDGQANELWYVTSPSSKDRLALNAKISGSKAKVIYFTELVGVFSQAVADFSDELKKDSDRYASCIARMKVWVRFVPTKNLEPVEESTDSESPFPMTRH